MKIDDWKSIEQSISIDNCYLIDIDFLNYIDRHQLLSIAIDISQRTWGSPGYPDIDLRNPQMSERDKMTIDENQS